ncbi:MAG: PstS family phosphate ABC transporter substrate-binding protein [Cyanobacteria bacterium P01_D01_bin.71]
MKTTKCSLLGALAGISGLALVGCSAPSDSVTSAAATIRIDGSSTVYPITVAIAEQYANNAAQESAIEVSFSGTGDGFAKFCAGETVINNASRPITNEEMQACGDADIRYFELPVAFDAITVVVNPQNDWAKDITVAELKTAWAEAGQRQVTRWSDIRSGWPEQAIALYGPGTASGTFDYFSEVIVGEDTAVRSDYVASEDDELLAQGIANDPNALGYFGFAYFEENANDLKALAVDSGSGAVSPSQATVESSEYQPLSRPLFIYVNAQAAQNNKALESFVAFYLEQAPSTVGAVGYIPLPQDGYEVALTQFYRGKVGTVFDGQMQPGLTIGELLSKRAKF